jgi:hypothetical protein
LLYYVGHGLIPLAHRLSLYTTGELASWNREEKKFDIIHPMLYPESRDKHAADKRSLSAAQALHRTHIIDGL